MKRRKFIQSLLIIPVPIVLGSMFISLNRSRIKNISVLEKQLIADKSIGLSVKCAIRNGGYSVLNSLRNKDYNQFGHDQVQVSGYLMNKNEFDVLNNWLLVN